MREIAEGEVEVTGEREREREGRGKRERGCKVRVSERCVPRGRCEANLSGGNKRSRDALSLQVLGLLQQRDQDQRRREGEKRRPSLHSRGNHLKDPSGICKNNIESEFFLVSTLIVLNCDSYI